MTEAEESNDTAVCRTADGIEYTPHSMMHKAVVRMDPTKLEMLDGFESVDAGHKFVPENSNVRVIVTGRDWSEKRILIYGSKSTEEARRHTEQIIERVHAIDFDAELIEGPTITNIAVSGDLGSPIKLENAIQTIGDQGYHVEYEPEQFPAAIVKIESPPVTFLLFSTGKFVIQGLRGFDEIEPAIGRVQEIL